MDALISQLKEDPRSSRLLHDFEFFEQTFLSPRSANPNALDDKKLVGVYHSDDVAPYDDHKNAAAMVEEMMNIEKTRSYQLEDDQCDATTKAVVETNCGGVNGRHDEDLELDHLLLDPKYLEYLGEVLNAGESGSGEGDYTFSDNELIDFDKYLENVLDEEATTPEVRNANAQTDHPSLKNSAGCENNVKRWATRKRLKKGTPEYARRQEEYKLMNRVAAAKSFERKQVSATLRFFEA